MIATSILIALAAAAAIFFIIVRCKKGGAIAIMIKTLASVLFIAVAVAGILSVPVIEKWMIFILFGLVFGLIGDIVLDCKVVYPESNAIYLTSGMLSFGIGHAMFFVAMLTKYNFNLTVLFIAIAIALPLAFIIGFGGKLLRLDYGKFKAHSIAYAFILIFMCAYSVGLFVVGEPTLQISIGLVLFLISDLALSTMYFGGKLTSKPLIAFNHATYYAAQICIAALIFFAA